MMNVLQGGLRIGLRSQKEGYGFWIEGLGASASRAQLLADFSESAENQTQLIGAMNMALRLSVRLIIQRLLPPGAIWSGRRLLRALIVVKLNPSPRSCGCDGYRHDAIGVREAATLGMGVALLVVPDALQGLLSGALVRVVPDWWVDAGKVSMFYSTRNLMPAKSRAFIDFVKEEFIRLGYGEQFDGSGT
ncbi:hypothetical protein ASC94_07030 [Massilia sp. Root418]|jgi:DNA-binding transcriptional LysR family regulator|uniref:hypothetical protein n=1 Tax=Massilia sp. Root418 TaxID=1736532 RepID=UPI0006FB8C5D|nr:hypothetical protein [Massilia sp. Root418]KQW96590.1 hypothetical protein ASC94_07030 [Massilia sp. Root418]